MAVTAAAIPGAVDAMFLRPTPQPIVTISTPTPTYPPGTEVTGIVIPPFHTPTPSMTPTVTATWIECNGGVCPSSTPIQATAIEITVPAGTP